MTTFATLLGKWWFWIFILGPVIFFLFRIWHPSLATSLNA